MEKYNRGGKNKGGEDKGGKTGEMRCLGRSRGGWTGRAGVGGTQKGRGVKTNLGGGCCGWLRGGGE